MEQGSRKAGFGPVTLGTSLPRCVQRECVSKGHFLLWVKSTWTPWAAPWGGISGGSHRPSDPHCPSRPSRQSLIKPGVVFSSHLSGNIDTGLPNRKTILSSLWQDEDKEMSLLVSKSAGDVSPSLPCFPEWLRDSK